MAERSVIIIGAGLAGLATGCYAQMNGYRTRIFEQHTRPGGVCTAWKRNGYTIDGCIHWLMGSSPGCASYELYREVGALDGQRLIPLHHLMRFVDERSGRCLEITADLDRLAADLKSTSPGDGPVIDELLTVTRAFRGFEIILDRPSQLMGPLDGLERVWRTRRWLKHLVRYNMPVAAFAKRFQDPFLRWAITNVFVPEMPASLLFIILAQLVEGKLATVEGGSLAFALSIARRYLELGGQITYGAAVQEVLVAPRARGKRDRAVGIRLEDGSEHYADAVVSAADGHSTIFGMLGGRYAGQKIRERYETWPLFPPIVTVSYGIGRPFAEPAGNLIRLQDPISIAGQGVEHLLCRIHSGSAFAPPGETVAQVLFTTDYDYWHDLQQADRARYEAEKERVAGQVLDRLERHLPGISASVEMTDVATPYTLWRYTRNYRGAFKGWLITTENAGKPLPKTLPGLEDFYMAGQWVEPGGGVPVALRSGRQVVQLLCHHDKVPFSADAAQQSVTPIDPTRQTLDLC